MKVPTGSIRTPRDRQFDRPRQSLLREQENPWIAREAAIGFTQLEAGQTEEVQSEQHLIDLVRGDA